MSDDAITPACFVCWADHARGPHAVVALCRCGHRRVEHNELAPIDDRIRCLAANCLCRRYEP